MTVVVPDAGAVEDQYVLLFGLGEVGDGAVIEVAGEFRLEHGSVPMSEIVSSGVILYYRPTGELMARDIGLFFFAIDARGRRRFQPFYSESGGDTLRMRDTESAAHGLEVLATVSAERSLELNANDAGFDGRCVINISSICLNAPPFTPERTSTTAPHGSFQVRAFDAAEEPPVQLSCLGPDGSTVVTRGDHVSCKVSVTPAQAYRVVSWHAQGADGNTMLGPTAPVQEPGTITEWAGPAVLATTVRVTAAVGSGAESRELPEVTASYTVRARPWKFQTSLRPTDQGHGDLVYPPTDNGRGVSRDLGDTHLLPDRPDLTRVSGHLAVPEGPNTGWLYTREPLPDPTLVTHISRALTAGDSWYDAHKGRRRPGGGFDCNPSDLDRLREHTLQHEGAVSGWSKSHYDVYGEYLAAHNLNAAFDTLTAFASETTIQEFYGRIVNVYRRWQDDLQIAHDEVDQNHGVQISCLLHVSPSASADPE